MSKNFNKFLISIFAVSALAFGAFHNDASAGFWDWFNLNKADKMDNSAQQQQAAAIANADTTSSSSASATLTAKTGDAYNITSTSATIYGTINPQGENVSVYFKYRKNSESSGATKTTSWTSTGSKSNDVITGIKISDLSSGTKYVYRFYAYNYTTGKTIQGDLKSFTTTSGSSSSNSSSSVSSGASSSSSASVNHTATTGEVTNVTSTSATLSGTVNPKGENVYYLFAYRKNSDSSSSTKYIPSAWKSVDSGSDDISVSVDISELSSGTKYVYKLYAYSSATKKTVNGELKSFTTSGSSSSNSSSSVSSGASSSSSSVQQYTLKVKISGAGKITSSGGSGVINCKKSVDSNGKSETSGDCTVKFNKGESVTLTPSTPSTQYEFATWAEDCRSAQKLSSCTIKMTGNKTVSATFNKKAGSSENTAAVSVRKTGKGVGKVISMTSTGKSMAGINCGNDCSENFKQYCETEVEGSRRCGMVYFKATAEKGSTFSGWGGDCLTFKNEKDQCYVTLDGAKTINANFNEGSGNTGGEYYDLTVTVSGNGVVKSSDNKINCSAASSGGSDCAHSYGKNGTVTLKATPNSGYGVGDFSGCDSKTKSKDGVLTCKIKMTKNQNFKINFTASVSSSSSSSSSISSSSSSASVNHTATTGEVTNVTSTSATLSGTVNPKGENVYYLFAYRKNSDSSSSTKYIPSAWKSVDSGSDDISVSVDISELSSGTKYVYKLYAYSSATKKTVNGELKSFTTSDGSSSSSSSSSSSQTTASTYKLKVTISGNGRIEDNYSKIDCGPNMACEAAYSKGQMIRIKTEDTDSTGASYNTKVESWSGGGCSGTGNSCEITMDEDKEVTVKFVSK